MHILDCKAYEDVITWAPDGKSFIVLDSAKFVDNVLTFHFKEAKFTSFLRKVSLTPCFQCPPYQDIKPTSLFNRQICIALSLGLCEDPAERATNIRYTSVHAQGMFGLGN
jgi:hypothetical protein